MSHTLPVVQTNSEFTQLATFQRREGLLSVLFGDENGSL